MEPAAFWWLMLPLSLCLIFSIIQTRIKIAVFSFSRRALTYWRINCILASIAVAAWVILGFPLPIFYIVLYFLYTRHLVLKPDKSNKDWLLTNLSYANMIALHLIIVGVGALIKNSTMYDLLSTPSGRAISLCPPLIICFVEDFCFLKSRTLANVLLSSAESDEAQPFMAFLWFCVVYLLIDSTLCIFRLEPLYPPLFLIGSSIVVMFTLLRFLLHINALIKDHHLKIEHDRLTSMLEATEENVDTLRQLAQKDVLTGVYSRLYAMERIDAMIAEESPFALVFLDLDALKQINDTKGHDAGDAYLVGFVAAVNEHLRKCDVLARVGGDEFIVLMPGCSVQTAEERFKAIRSCLENDKADDGQVFRFSYGVSAYSKSIADAKSLLGEADGAMYRDKARRHGQGGRL